MGAKTYGWLIFTWMVMMFLDAIGSGTTNAEYSSNANIALSLNVLKMYNIGFISIPHLMWVGLVRFTHLHLGNFGTSTILLGL